MKAFEETERAAANVKQQMKQESGLLKVGLIAGDNASVDRSNVLRVTCAFGRLVDGLVQTFPRLQICVPVSSRAYDDLAHPLQLESSAVTPLPAMTTTLGSQTQWWSCRKIVRSFAAKMDVLLIRFPFQLPGCLLNLPKPKVLHVIGNPIEVVRHSTNYGPILKPLALGYAHYMMWVMRRMMSESQTRAVTHGEEIWNALNCSMGRVVVSSCIRASEICNRGDTVLNDPPRLLFVGYIRPEKGIDTLLDAFHKIRIRRPISLTIVGGADRSNATENQLLLKIEQSSFASDICIKGHVPFGEALFDLYRQHDIFVLPSLSEGTPRALVEARCFGCAVVASRVGGIPSSVIHEEDGLLVPPQDSTALALSIERLLDDEALRRRLQRTGYEHSSRRTVESFAAEIALEVELAASGKAFGR